MYSRCGGRGTGALWVIRNNYGLIHGGFVDLQIGTNSGYRFTQGMFTYRYDKTARVIFYDKSSCCRLASAILCLDNLYSIVVASFLPYFPRWCPGVSQQSGNLELLYPIGYGSGSVISLSIALHCQRCSSRSPETQSRPATTTNQATASRSAMDTTHISGATASLETLIATPTTTLRSTSS
jgi:hypothetical protein